MAHRADDDDDNNKYIQFLLNDKCSMIVSHHGLASRVEECRRRALDALGTAVHSHINDLMLINNTTTTTTTHHNCTTTIETSKQQQQQQCCGEEIHFQLAQLLRLSETCPFKDVRQKCCCLLKSAQEQGLSLPTPLNIGPSSFLPISEVIPNDTADENVRQLYIEAFLQSGRLDNVIKVMALHDQYLVKFLSVHNFILHGDGPLPSDYRHYIAIMAASRHQCSYIVKLQEQEFLQYGGSPDWLKGLDYIPQKLHRLSELNKLLAHRPWLVTKEHIENLLRGADSWSLSELLHAIIIMAHNHTLAGFVHGCGVNPEIDHDNGFTVSGGNNTPTGTTSTHTPTTITQCNGSLIHNDTQCCNADTTQQNSEDSGKKLADILETMRKLAETSDQTTSEEQIEQYKYVANQSAELPTGPDDEPIPRADVSRYMTDPLFGYQDFSKRGQPNDMTTFRAQDYSWADHGFSIVNRLYPGMGQLLDDRFETAYNLTYNTFGTLPVLVDTSLFRRAIWNYIHCLFGIRHDDYNYREVNQLLEKPHKMYIKTVACHPEKATKRMYDSWMDEFLHSEKVHINLMLLEARMQAELLYVLRAITRYMK